MSAPIEKGAGLRLRAFARASEFLEAALAHLEEDDVQNNLLISMALDARADRESPGRRWLLALRGDRPAAAALALAEGRIALAKADAADAVDFGAALARSLKRAGRPPWRALGPSSTARTFFEGWSGGSGRRPGEPLARQTIMSMDLIERASTDPGAIAGVLSKATPEDEGLLRTWMRAFDRETEAPRRSPQSSQPPADAWIAQAIAAGDAYVWRASDGIKATASVGGRTRESGRVHLVFTPQENRRKGCARACVNALTEELRKRGFKRAALFADAKSKPALALYESIGFRRKGEFEELELAD